MEFVGLISGYSNLIFAKSYNLIQIIISIYGDAQTSRDSQL